MNISPSSSARRAGFALLMVMILAAAMILILAASMYRTSTVATLNQRNNDYNTCANAAEAAVEKVFAKMAYDFQSYGVGQVSNNISSYMTNIPTAAEDTFWTNFVFSDAKDIVVKLMSPMSIVTAARYLQPTPTYILSTRRSIVSYPTRS